MTKGHGVAAEKEESCLIFYSTEPPKTYYRVQSIVEKIKCNICKYMYILC
jgi:hypothetical protein